jgi:hypothetical protein
MSPTRKTQITLIALLMIALITFSAWAVLRRESYSFQLPNPPTPQPSSTPTVTPDTGLVLNIPQKALMKNYVTVSAEAPSGTKCELIYIPPSGNTHKTDTIADASGLCVWKWKAEESEGKGNARLIFTIGNISETHFIQILSSF